MNTSKHFVSRRNFSTERQYNTLKHKKSEVPEEVKRNFIKRIHATLENKL